MFLPFITLKDPIIMDIYLTLDEIGVGIIGNVASSSKDPIRAIKLLNRIVFSNCFGEERGKWWLRGLLLRIRVALPVSSVPFLPTKNGNVIRYSSSLSRRIIASRFAALCHANILQRN